jgi:GTP-binding protein LepA
MLIFHMRFRRSIAACEGALLIVDASQGIEAQTISNLYLALDHDLEIIPVINKIDLPGAQPEEVRDQIVDLLGIDGDDVIYASAKAGVGIDEILEAIVHRIPAPKGDPDAPLQAMIFDSVFNSYRGIEVIFRVFQGKIGQGDKVKFMNTGKTYDADEVGVLKLSQQPAKTIGTGNVGYLISGHKNSQGGESGRHNHPC